VKRVAVTAWITLAALNCLVLVPLLGSHWLPPRDFGMFYTAAKVYEQQPHNRLYDLSLQLRTQQRLYGIPYDQSSKRFLPYNHLPYELVLFLPLTVLPPPQAAWVWRIENVLLLAFTICIFAEIYLSQRSGKEMFLIALAFFPVPYCLLTGQDTFVTLALFAVSLWMVKTERYVLAGAMLGLCLFKFQLILPIMGILVLRRSWRLITGFTAAGIGVLLVSTIMIGRDGMLSLLRLWLKGETGAIACISPLTMPNVRGLLSSLPGLSPIMVTSATLAASVFLLFLATYYTRAAPTFTHFFSVALCFVILVSFHTNLYDLAILILPAFVLLDMDRATRPSWIGTTTYLLLFCPPLYVAAISTSHIPFLAFLVGLLWTALSLEPAATTEIALPVPATLTVGDRSRISFEVVK